MEEGFVRAVHTGTGLEQDIPLTWFDVFPGMWRNAAAAAEAPAEAAIAPAPVPPAVIEAPAVPVPAEAPVTAPAPEGDAA